MRNSKNRRHGWMFILMCMAMSLNAPAEAQRSQNAADVIDRIRPAIVAVGTFSQTRTPRFQFSGTGFVVGDGTVVATNVHVLPTVLDAANQEVLVVATGTGVDISVRTATKLALDSEHDVALVKITGSPLPALRLKEDVRARPGDEVYFTGYPLGTALGLYPVTHRAMISAIVPISMPLPDANSLDPKVVRRMRQGPFPVLQLDGTAYPGNSGSPLYDLASGEVMGVLNMVFVKGTKEAALTAPSGITYAIPVTHLKKLLTP